MITYLMYTTRQMNTKNFLPNKIYQLPKRLKIKKKSMGPEGLNYYIHNNSTTEYQYYRYEI